MKVFLDVCVHSANPPAAEKMRAGVASIERFSSRLAASQPAVAASAIDRSFDHLFAARSGLPWWPWVGARFQQAAVRTLIVGESVYVWQNADRAAFDRRYGSVEGLRDTHTRHALDFSRGSRFVRNIERAIFAKRRPATAEKAALWHSVAYHNLVLRPLASPRHRPNEADYRAGWSETLALCQLLGIEQCLVYGLETPKVHALKDTLREQGGLADLKRLPASVGGNRPYAGTFTVGGRMIDALFVRHPSAFFSWQGWAPVIRDRLSLSFIGTHPDRSDQAPLS